MSIYGICVNLCKVWDRYVFSIMVVIIALVSCINKNNLNPTLAYDLSKTVSIFIFEENKTTLKQKLYFTKDSLLACCCYYRSSTVIADDSLVFFYGVKSNLIDSLKQFYKDSLVEFHSYSYNNGKMISRIRDNNKDSFVYVGNKLFSQISDNNAVTFFTEHATYFKLSNDLQEPIDFQYLNYPKYILNADEYEQQYFQMADTAFAIIKDKNLTIKKYNLNKEPYMDISDFFPIGTNDHLDSAIYIYDKNYLISTDYFLDTSFCTGCSGLKHFKVRNNYTNGILKNRQIILDYHTQDTSSNYKIVYIPTGKGCPTGADMQRR